MDGIRQTPYFHGMTLDDAVSAPGRPREFCTEAALAAALQVFWSRGYDAASLSELTEAMGISRPSLYAAFGNKEALFRKALDLYERKRAAVLAEALDAPTARGVAERLLRGALAMHGSGTGPKGCLMVNHAVAGGAGIEAVRDEVAVRLAGLEAALLRRFERAEVEGDLRADIKPAALLRYFTAIWQGLALQAGTGASRADLEGLVETALLVWPGR